MLSFSRWCRPSCYGLLLTCSIPCYCQVVQIFWNGLMTEVMMTAFLMSAEPDDGAPLSPIRLIILAVIGAGTLVAMAMCHSMVKVPPLAVSQLGSRASPGRASQL